jgi:hypothetical protein
MIKQLLTTVLILFSLTTVVNAQTVVETTTDSKSDVTTSGKTIVISPPPSAISPSVNSSSSDLCTVGVAGAVQTQILGISTGETYRDMNCERLKISKTLYDMGMKVAAVSVLCQDRRTFDAMTMAGTPCPYLGEIGDAATDGWEENPHMKPEPEIVETKSDIQKKQAITAGATIGTALLFLLLL